MSFCSLRITVIASGILFFGGWGNAARAAETYKVQLVRPYKVGYEYTTDTTIYMKRSARGQTAAFAGELRGTMKVLAVNEKNGGVTKVQCTVAKLTRDGKDLCPAGAIIVAQRANRADTITVNGQPAASDAMELLREVLGLTDPSITVSDDQALGTTQPQPVGIAWPVNKQFTARQSAEIALAALPASVKGESKIVNVKPVNGVDAMRVRTAVSYDLLPHHNPGKVPIIGGSINIHQELLLPVDTAQPMISATQDAQLTEIELTRAGQVTISLDLQLTRNDQPKK